MDVVCLGESMVAFRPSRPGGLAEADSFDRGVGGAESNVACTLARAGHSARWISRVGADAFGDHLLRAVAACGVDTAHVVRDPRRPTGVYFRTHGERGADLEVAYYRAGSAASAMCPDTVDRAAADTGRVLHLTGITAALSDGCLALLHDLTAARPGRPLVSFDVNHRPALWTGRAAQARTTLLGLARAADVVFVGEDEATDIWGITGGPAAVRAALPEPPVVVVKQGGRGATAFAGQATVPVPAPAVDVVAAVGAGDAFAAGYLSATLRGLPLRTRLRHGHLTAAAALTAAGDTAAPPGRDRADRLAALDDEAWGRLRLGPRWTTEEATA
ncbi:sugar kinase [Streptomyces sp. 549]|uniref:sugar kinase n=1 Tax=Streptomyces sp. 549 TaxID=3049076 RepID=UPI0024C434B6|nr:sugar kinase [Streptomyces sp. 549]MDK1476974.1 sugar kinase [Streptomyces sp. 549]